MSGFTLSIARVDHAGEPSVTQRMLCDVDWAYLPRVGERVTVGRSLMLDLTVEQVWHEEGAVAVDLGRAVLDEDATEHLVRGGWRRVEMPAGRRLA